MKILFICTGNTCRSVLARYYAVKLAPPFCPELFKSVGKRAGLAADLSAEIGAKAGVRLRRTSCPPAVVAGEFPGLYFSSAGLAVGKNIMQPFIVAELLEKEGVKDFSHKPAQVTAEMAGGADLILTMTAAQKADITGLFPKAAAKTATLLEYAGFGAGDIADPYGRDEIVYCEIFKLIKTAVKVALEKLQKKVK